jgi:3-hydroxyisobutyrate dehydrogenase-like beta-hydroxyacid dehydrogenase
VKVGFLGTGLMGQPMVKRLLEAKISVVAYNRTQSKLAPLRDAGAKIADSPQEAIRESECVILMLTNATAIYDTLLSEASRQELKGRIVVQMGRFRQATVKRSHLKLLLLVASILKHPYWEVFRKPRQVN